MKAVILARVSTKEQEEGHSISAQIERLKEYCDRKNLTLLKTYKIIESSTRGKRKDFYELLKYCKSRSETTAIVADAVDRVQRSFKESVALDDLIRKEIIELHFYREGMIIGKGSTATEHMRWDFSVMGAKSYVLQLSENVKRSIDFKIKNGQLCGPAPVGYVNVKDSNGKSTVILDPEKSYLVKRIFTEYSKGLDSYDSMVKKVEEWGLMGARNKKLSKNGVATILQNKFYYGIMKHKGKYYPHCYEQLISKSLYDKCNKIINSRGNSQVCSKRDNEFIFRGLIKCTKSGRTVGCDKKKGKYNYLISYDDLGKATFWTNENIIEDEITDILHKIKIPDDILSEINSRLKDSNNIEAQYYQQEIKRLSKELKVTNEKLAKLLDLLLEDKISSSTYDKKLIELEENKKELTKLIEKNNKGDEQFRFTTKKYFELANRAYDLYFTLEVEEKQQLLKTIFSNLYLNGQKLVYTLNTPFYEIAKSDIGTEWRE